MLLKKLTKVEGRRIEKEIQFIIMEHRRDRTRWKKLCRFEPIAVDTKNGFQLELRSESNEHFMMC